MHAYIHKHSVNKVKTQIPSQFCIAKLLESSQTLNKTVDDIKTNFMRHRPQQQLEPETVHSDIFISPAVPAVTVTNGLRQDMCNEVNQYYFTSCSAIGGSGGSHFSNNAEADGPSHNGGTLSG